MALSVLPLAFLEHVVTQQRVEVHAQVLAAPSDEQSPSTRVGPCAASANRSHRTCRSPAIRVCASAVSAPRIRNASDLDRWTAGRLPSPEPTCRLPCPVNQPNIARRADCPSGSAVPFAERLEGSGRFRWTLKAAFPPTRR